MAEKLVLFPFGGNAREAVSAIEALNAAGRGLEIVGFLDDNHAHLESAEAPLLGGRSAWKDWRGKARLLALPGNPASYLQRAELIDSFALGADDSLAVIDPAVRISPSAVVGFNTLVQAFCYVGVGAQVGNHCVLLSHVVVSHDTTIGDYTMVGAHASIAGGVRIGRNCYIGAASSLRSGVTIGGGALVGMGANVIGDVPSRAVVVGNPARILRMQQ